MLLASRAGAALMVPELNSRNPDDSWPVVFLDFDGNDTADYGPYHPGHTPAYSTDADVNNFSQQELDNIVEIWKGVSEKYSPFNLNVTTVDPHSLQRAMNIVIGGNGAWAPSAPDGSRPGGISITGSFAIDSANFPDLGFVFPTQLVNGTPRYVTEAAAHEAGHGFGLSHQSRYSPPPFLEYNPGDALKAPIMGRSYFAQRGTWWLGPTPDSSSPNAQDDLFIISDTRVHANGFGYRDDDHPNLPTAVGDPLTIGPGYVLGGGEGVIEKITDADFFQFVAPSLLGSPDPVPAHIVADVAPYAPMLDLTLKLYNGAGTLLATSNTPNLGEFIDFLLTPGQTYKVGIFSAGQYGDIGQFSISGFVPEPTSAVLFLMLPAALLTRRRTR
jgi:hypothetical protein